MASIVNRPNGRKSIQFVDFGGKRQELRLGIQTTKDAEKVASKIETMLSDAALGRPYDLEVAAWIKSLSQKFLERLERCGLAKGTSLRTKTLGEFLEDHFATMQTRVKPGTFVAYSHTRENLIAHFGAGHRLLEISPQDADGFRDFLMTSKQRRGEGHLAKATINRRVRVARAIFAMAQKRKCIDENPFNDVLAGDQINKARQFFVTREITEKAIQACPDSQWRLMVALARYGGVRCPSEIVTLTWSDVHWHEKKITVHSPKTEHHEGMDCRIIPMFPEIEPYLREVHDQAESKTGFVITRYRSTSTNLRTQLLKIIKRAGLLPWPKLWQNLRSSRETELGDAYPLHVVCQWIGHSPRIAINHYMQTTDAHFTRAIASTSQ